jgi:molybdopterin converting factor small subunit
MTDGTSGDRARTVGTVGVVSKTRFSVADSASLIRLSSVLTGMPVIKVPAALAGGSSTSKVEVDGETLGEALDSHAAEHGPELRDSVVEDDQIKEFINIFVDGSEAESLEQQLEDDSQVRVMPAASGGR